MRIISYLPIFMPLLLFFLPLWYFTNFFFCHFLSVWRTYIRQSLRAVLLVTYPFSFPSHENNFICPPFLKQFCQISWALEKCSTYFMFQKGNRCHANWFTAYVMCHLSCCFQYFIFRFHNYNYYVYGHGFVWAYCSCSPSFVIVCVCVFNQSWTIVSHYFWWYSLISTYFLLLSF